MNQNVMKILIVEDDPAVCNALSEALRLADYECESVDSGDDAIARVLQGGIGLVLTDVNLRGKDGFAVLAELTARADMPPVVMMTAYGSIDRAVRAMKGGALDYLPKPFRTHELLQCIARHLRPPRSDDPVAVDLRSQAVLLQARRIASADANVMISGESGTGKEVYAQFIHKHSRRAGKPFVALNCAALPANLIESILFGHDKHAFTGAGQSREGKFSQANGGTLLLDEITEIPVELQAKLLRALQEGEIDPVGAKTPVPVNVRVVATSNRRIEEAIADGVLREDLYYRLNVLPLHLPPLRERPGDILPLARAILARHSQQQHRSVQLSAAAEASLLAHQWPGNVRELDNVLLRTMVLYGGEVMQAPDLGIPLGSHVDASAQQRRMESAAKKLEGNSLDVERQRLEEEVIRKTLREHGGHKGNTAKALGIADRTLRHRLQQLRERAS